MFNEIAMFVVVSYIVCNMYMIIETAVFGYVGVVVCGITVVINSDGVVDDIVSCV